MEMDSVLDRGHSAIAMGEELDLPDLGIEGFRVGVGHPGGGDHGHAIEMIPHQSRQIAQGGLAAA